MEVLVPVICHPTITVCRMRDDFVYTSGAVTYVIELNIESRRYVGGMLNVNKI